MISIWDRSKLKVIVGQNTNARMLTEIDLKELENDLNKSEHFLNANDLRSIDVESILVWKADL